MDLKAYIEERRKEGKYVELEGEVDPHYEVARYLKRHDGGPTLLFNKVKGHSIPVVGNLVTKREDIVKLLRVKDLNEAYLKLLEACNSPSRLKLKSDAPFEEVRLKDLRDLPILTHYERDGGPYITTSVVIARDYDTGAFNASIHRMLMVDPTHLAIRVVPRHLHYIMTRWWEKGKDLPIAVVIGSHPAMFLAAASSPPLGVFEAEVANNLLNGKLEGCLLNNGIIVPRSSEIVIIGRILRDSYVEEGPFVDVTGTYDKVRRQPVVEVEAIYAKEEALYHALLPASREHRIFMSFYREALIWQRVKEVVPTLKAVRLTTGGCNWLHCVLSIRKVNEGDPKNAMLAAFAAHPSLKMVIVVDEDIDPDSPEDVEWALATRFQPDEDLVVISRIRGSSLDPSSDQERLLTSKMGIDATTPLNRPRDLFERAKIP